MKIGCGRDSASYFGVYGILKTKVNSIRCNL